MPFAPQAIMDSNPTWIAQPDDYVTTLTSAAAITLPSPGFRLVKVQVNTGATPGYFQIVYDGISIANFAAPSNGTIGGMAWAVTWPFVGTTLPASLFTFGGGLTSVTLTFSRGKSRGPTIDKYRSIVFTVTTSATHSTATAFSAGTYSVTPAVPTGVLAFATYGGGVFVWPQVAASQSQHACDQGPTGSATVGVAPALPKANTLTPLYLNLLTAAGTITAFVGYDPQ